MGYPDIDALNGKMLVQREFTPNVFVVNVSVDRPYRANFLDLVGYFEASDIARVPNFIRLGAIGEYFIIDMTMSVGQQQNFSGQIGMDLFNYLCWAQN